MSEVPVEFDRRTRFAQLSPQAARVLLAALTIAACLLVSITLSPWKSGFADAPSRGASDVDLYLAEAGRIRGGESSYDVAKSELVARGYPTRSVLNWRTPLPVWLVSVLPAGWGQALVALLAAAVLAIAAHVVAKDAGLYRALVTLFLLSGALLAVVLRGAFIMPEVWCGVFIALSLLCFGIQRRGLAVFFGLAALFVRELAAPYCLVCGLFALCERRWREVAAWFLGAIAYSAFYVWHIAQVLPLIDTDALAHHESWLQFGGAAFVISLVQMNLYLLLLPQWLSALYLVVSLLGFVAHNSGWGRRAAWTACVYVLAFGVVGYPFNQYWGALLAPLFCFGAAQGIAALFDIGRAARLSLPTALRQKDPTMLRQARDAYCSRGDCSCD